jgi:hypothetical protein
MAYQLPSVQVSSQGRTKAGTDAQKQVIDLTSKRGRDDDVADEPHKRRALDKELFVGSRPLWDYPTLQVRGKEIIDLTDSSPPSPTRSTLSPATITQDHSPERDNVVTLPCISCSEEFEISLLAHMACKSLRESIATCLSHDHRGFPYM